MQRFIPKSTSSAASIERNNWTRAARWLRLVFVLYFCATTGGAQGTHLRESEKGQYSFYRPYLRNWFTDTLPQHRDIGGAINRSIVMLLEQHNLLGSLSDGAAGKWIDLDYPQEKLGKMIRISIPYSIPGGFSLHFVASNFGPPDIYLNLDQVGLYLLKQRIESAEFPFYLIRQSHLPPDPILSLELNWEGLSIYQDYERSGYVDLNGDGLRDRVIVSKYGVSSQLNTGFGLFGAEELSREVFAMRIGYIASYTLAFSGLTRESSLSESGLQGDTSDSHLKVETEQPGTLPLTVENFSLSGSSYSELIARLGNFARDGVESMIPEKYISSNYDSLEKLAYELAKGEGRFSSSAFQIGFSVGSMDGRADRWRVEEFGATLDELAKANINILGDEAVRRLAEPLEILKFPLFRTMIRDRASGVCVGLDDFYQADAANLKEAVSKGSAQAAFVKKVMEYNPFSKISCYKNLSVDSRFTICNPALLSGMALGFVAVIGFVGDSGVDAALRAGPARENPALVWSPIRQRVATLGVGLDEKNVKALSASAAGTATILIELGFKSSNRFLDNWIAGAAERKGQIDASNRIVDALRASFPQFAPTQEIRGPQEAAQEIGRFVGGLYATIDELRATIVSLRNLVDTLQGTIETLTEVNQRLNEALTTAQQALSEARDRFRELQETIANINEAAKSATGVLGDIGRITNILANTTEVLYYGSSVGVTYEVGSAAVNGVKHLISLL